MSISLFLLLFLHPFFSCSNVFSQQAHAPDDGHARFEMMHRHSPQLAKYNLSNVGPPKTRRERMEQLIQSDNARQEAIAHKIWQRQRGPGAEGRRAAEVFPGVIANSQIEIPLRSAADTGIGQYFVSFRVGTPPQKFVLIADTGSDLTWMNCDYVKCRECPKRNGTHHGRIFHADKSSSFKTISCLSETCKVELQQSFSLTRCPTPSTPCAYDYRYFDGSRVQGFFATETVKVALDSNRKKIKLPDVIVGCSHSSEGPSFKEADGVMGLGYGSNSFALKAARLFGNKFSYCLVDHLSPSNLVNFLSFGNATKSNNRNMQYTNLILGVVNPYYAVSVSGISLGGKMMDIPPEIWDIYGAGGAILDSGSTLTFLVEPAYKVVIAALENAILSVQKSQKLRVGVGPLKSCFTDKGFEMARVPELVWHFAGGAKLAAPVKSYVVDADEGVKCLAFASSGWPGTSVIGNIMQQNHLWEFDLARSKVGFAPSSCLELQPKM